MRENCTYGSEGREQELPYPYRQPAARLVARVLCVMRKL